MWMHVVNQNIHSQSEAVASKQGSQPASQQVSKTTSKSANSTILPPTEAKTQDIPHNSNTLIWGLIHVDACGEPEYPFSERGSTQQASQAASKPAHEG